MSAQTSSSPAGGARATSTRADRTPGRRSLSARREERAAYAFVAPNMVLLALFVLVPLVGAFVISFQRTNGFGAAEWTGLANYQRGCSATGCSGGRCSTRSSSRCS